MTTSCVPRVRGVAVFACALALSILAAPASGKDCGADVACECGDRVTQSVVLTQDLNNCTGAGLELSAGPHKVTCTTADGKAQNAVVTVPADGVARYKFSL